MKYQIKMGIPEMEEYWGFLSKKAEDNSLKGDEKKLFKKLVKTLMLLSENPRHPGLSSHEIDTLSRRYGMKVWESYLENRTPGAGRIFWVYGPDQSEITIIAIEPHPEDKKKSGYSKIKLSSLEERH